MNINRTHSTANNFGAVNALKGYRAQFVYSLSRILCHQSDEVTFRPEGKFEDLDIYDEHNKVIEIVQVKCLGETLTLSDIISQKTSSFLKRALEAHKNGFRPKITLVSFGQVNDDIRGLAENNLSTSLNNKLKKFGLTEEQNDTINKHFRYEIVSEDTLIRETKLKIQDLKIFADTDVSLDLLIYWLYNSAINQRIIDIITLHDQLTVIGKFQSDRVSFHNTFGTLIRPLVDEGGTDDIQKLQRDFYKGISASYAHILAGIDVVRKEKLEQISKSFKTANTLFIHGASGQGKSTLAYRYLHDYCTLSTAFIITLPPDVATLYEIINTLHALSANINFPITLYIDIIPGHTDWITALQQLGTKNNLNFLLTVREEDWNSVQIEDKFTYSEIELGLDQKEAELIYEALNKFDLDLQFTDFQDAWNVFGESGPLLEFVYLVTQGESLPAKLKSQIDRIIEEYNEISKDKIKLLRIVVIADCFNARVLYKEIASHLKLDNISRLTELLEREYLIKLSDGKSFLTGLHPVRSGLLKKLLFDPELHDESEFVIECLHFLDPSTIYSFLRSAFRYTKINVSQLIAQLQTVNARSWVYYNAVLKSLVWMGVSDFIERNKEILNRAVTHFGRAWVTVVNVDISNALVGDEFTSIHSLFSEDQQKVAREINAQLRGSQNIYDHCISWIRTIKQIAIDPMTEEDFRGFASFIFWTDKLGASNIDISISKQSIIDGFKKHTLDALSRALFALKLNTQLRPLHQDTLQIFLDRFFITHNVIALNDANNEIVCEYFFNILENRNKYDTGNFIHDRSVQIINQLRLVYPNKDTYGTDGYGHKLSFIPDMHDDSHKRIPKRNLPLDYLVEVNSIFINLFDYSTRLSTWAEYVNQVVERRVMQIDILQESINSFAVYHKKKTYNPLVDFTKKFWNTLRPRLEEKSRPSLPKLILDEWGLTGEGNRADLKGLNANNDKFDQRSTLSLKRFETFRTSYQEYDNAISNYLWQSTAQISTEIRKRTNQQTSESNDYSRVSLVGNLFKAYEIIEEFQEQFKLHFNKFVKPQILADIEAKEKSYVAALCFIYRHFLNSKSFINGNLLKMAHEHVNQARLSFAEKVTNDFTSLAKELDCNFDVKWDEAKRRVIIFIRGESSIKMYGAIERVYSLFFSALGKPDPTSVRYGVLSKYYKSFLVIPLMGINSVNGKCYEFKFYKIMDSKFQELAQFHLIPQDIPNEIIAKYQIQSWNKILPEFEKIDRILSCAATAHQLAFHFVQFMKFSGVESNPLGEQVLEPYLANVTSKLQENVQEALDLFGYLVESCNKEKYTFESETFKFEFFDFLLSTHKLFSPSGDNVPTDEGERAISTNELKDWIPRLERLSNNIGIIYMVLSDCIIANHHSKQRA
ncbi:hypothetical protein SanaruYs_05470 [Chryseotalea sanaruensis]|uniref:Uncharacterized protein n=1 Tax=Chryseotalea sanaruensis TaxID=2482724 RepID=A0A401U645_9BACT|nr:hypothetical protein [Chryseotalea sanaruensis]GCC50332.1 hypothetical protein SanaruYs_05470 [Chryseotalea sanaruensis]